MRVTIGQQSQRREAILDYCSSTYKVSLNDFAPYLESLTQFSHVNLETSWGLLILTWTRSDGVAVNSVFLDILEVTKGTVIDDATGQIVSRWRRLADQLVKDAEDKVKPTLEEARH